MDITEKKSFVLYSSFYNPIKNLSDKKLGKLFRAIFEYQMSQEPDLVNEPDVKMAFEFFKNQFNVDNEKYEKRVEANRINGLKGGRRNKNQSKANQPNGLNSNPNKPNYMKFKSQKIEKLYK